MCGIAGIFNFQSQNFIDSYDLDKMISILHHRGPDESGIYLDDWIGLAHSRLSIIDLNSGTQPIHNEDETLWIVFNGEIFNYLELREELSKRGHQFYTDTDTEVILHLFEEKGVDCLNDLNGQFAFAIWDSKKRELFLARDRVGIRPLYYTIYNKQFFFASEIKSIFTIKNTSNESDPLALNQIFTFWTTLPGKTFFKDIHELPPGYCVKIKNKIEIIKYWELPFVTKENEIKDSEETICLRVEELLTDAIRIRLRSDVPVGCYLSGGLDSSGIASLVKSEFNNQLQTFGMQFNEKSYDERVYQSAMVSFLQTDHTTVNIQNPQIGKNFSDVLWFCEKPLLRTSPVPLYLLSEQVQKNNFKVVLTGEGADEVFGGYNIFREAKVRSFWAKYPNSSFRPLLLAKLYPYILQDKKLQKMLTSFFGHGLDQIHSPFFSHLVRWRNADRLKMFFSSEIKHQANDYNPVDALQSLLPDNFTKLDLLAKAQYLEMMLFMSNYLLSSQGDRVAMAHSIEIRLPYLDHRLIEYLGKVPAKLKIKALQEKYLLKKLFAKKLPQTIVKRPKHPYRAPIKKGLLESKSSFFEEMLSEKKIDEYGLFNPQKVCLFLKKATNTERLSEFDEMALAGILSTQLIYHQFIDDFKIKCVSSVMLKKIIDKRTNTNLLYKNAG